jgi:hypothetical protein
LDDLTFLADSQSREENEDEPVLSKRQAELRVPRDLKQTVPVAPLEEQLVRWRLPDGETAEYERAGGERKRLLSALPIGPDQRNSVRLLEPIPRYDELAVRLA